MIGGGVAAWAAAAAFVIRLPQVRVSVSAGPTNAPGMADLVATAPPSILDFHADLRIDEREVMAAARGVFRLGSRYLGWGGKRSSYLHTHGSHGEALGGVAFHQHWLRLNGDAGAFENFSPAAALANAGRFTRPFEDPESPLAGFSYGMAFDPARYARFLQTLAVGRGAVVDSAGATPDADLIVDTLAPLDAPDSPDWEDWSAAIPGGWLAVREEAPATGAALTETVSANPDGWRMEVPLRGVSHRIDLSADRREGAVCVRSGRRKTFWRENLVSIADAAVAIEPLDGVALHLIYSQIDRIIAMLPTADFPPVELAEYNRQTGEEADRVRDFVALHYRGADRREDRWRAVRDAAPPPTLAHDLVLFGERGILPIHDYDSFPIDSWLAVLLGQGVRPRRHDPMAIEFDRDTVLRWMATKRDHLSAAVQGLPTHQSLLAQLEG